MNGFSHERSDLPVTQVLSAPVFQQIPAKDPVLPMSSLPQPNAKKIRFPCYPFNVFC